MAGLPRADLCDPALCVANDATMCVGTDLCSTAAVDESIAKFGSKYLRRVYTEAEIAYADAAPVLRSERLAARFAAKEATLKVLRPVAERPEWRSIEVVKTEGGWCELRLHATARALAERRGVRELALSVSHDGGYATAIVVARLAPCRNRRAGGQES